ncbi:transglutaminase-like domain-containing protein [Clostridium sp. BNL1100]|uniref:transglutaminase-like domain-containing protein n=1 Tax=Clostridium sp. BNL1100 TaxID=755731 RepID=UPI00024A7CD3|nr:transglutaminase-like domain-containing protein [Clostridium sp. BNL1100]AEY66216.1 transglutaminase-like enzyme, predicted cysteine protease [Clostridium sp. BNL1100]
MVRENKYGVFVNLILVILLSLSVCQTLYTSLFMTYRWNINIFLYVIPLTFVFYLALKNKVTCIVSGVLLFLFAGFVFVIIYLSNSFSSYSIWLIDTMQGYINEPNSRYQAITLFFIAFIVTLMVYIFAVKLYNIYLVSFVTFSLFFGQAYANIFVSKPAFVLFLFSFLLYYFFYILKGRTEEKSYDPGNRLKYLLYIIPVCIAVLVISFSFPIGTKRISWSWLDHKLDNAIESFSQKNTSSFDFFSLNATGFGSNDILGGNISPDKTHVMDVKSEYYNLYLKASSKAYYNGHGWYDTDPVFNPVYGNAVVALNNINMDANQLEVGALINNSSSKDELYKSSKIEVKFKNLKTKSLFIPPKTFQITPKKELGLFTDRAGMISAEKPQNSNFEYIVNFDYMFLNSDKFKDRLRKSYKGYWMDNINEYEKNQYKLIFNIDIDNLSVENKQIIDSVNIFSVLQEQLRDIYSKYVSLPSTVTQRVRDLAENITINQGNNYDKAKAIETYLATNYPYTLKPGKPPLKKDFVDYFLFEGKKGYCTYYATAMTVMLRCLGIPARYVEGYILPPDNRNGVFKVTNQQAHAWVEAYFEGFGWIPFEPTSPFVAAMYQDNHIRPVIASNMTGQYYDEYRRMMEKYQREGQNHSIDLSGNFPIGSKDTNTTRVAFIIAISLISLILLSLLFVVLFNRIRFYYLLGKIRKQNSNDAVLTGYKYIIKLFKMQNVTISAGETPFQFGIRVEKLMDFKGYSFNKYDFNIITEYYVKARYSRDTLPDEAKQDMINFIETVLKLTSDKVSKVKFNFYKYFLGKV